MKRPLLFTLLLILIFVSASHGAPQAKEQETIIRVLIADSRDSIRLSLEGAYTIYAAGEDNILMKGPHLNATVSATEDGIKIGKEELKVKGVKVTVKRDSNIYVDKRRFRGDIYIMRKDDKKLMVINHIALDQYIYGVLYHEVSHRWPMEALKAQAITARTFALYQARQNKLQPYDLRNDIYSQVYGGRTFEKWATTRAVNLTKDEVLSYKGDIFPSYYHATCAGQTEDASNLWNIDIPPLDGVICNFCSRSPHYRWSKDIPLVLVENKLKENGHKIGRIVSAKVVSKNASGRVDKVEFKDDADTSIVLNGKDFRQIIGPNELRSTRFDLSLKQDKLAVKGSGWGHGVGMCQWGVFGMSRKGKKAEEILKYYYPGSEVTTIDKLKR